MAFFIGQRVVCIRDSGGVTKVKINKGEVVTIECIQTCPRMPHYRIQTGLIFVEVCNPEVFLNGWRSDYNPENFRPVKTTDISIFTSMLTKPPAKTRERA